MPTEAAVSGQSVAVFLIAHQDDECGAYQQMIMHRELDRRVVCACFTRGVVGDRDSSRREAETVRVLGELGIPAEDIIFAGRLLGIDDLALVDNMPEAADWLKEWLESFESVAAVYTMAYEGGHPDHDALHAVSVQVCYELGLLPRLQQYPLYNGYKLPWQFFRALTPIPENGPVNYIKLPWSLRLKFLRFFCLYTSQWKTWIGLFPFFVFHYFTKGTHQFQRVSLERLEQRPHEGELYYETRGFATWSHVRAKTAELLEHRRKQSTDLN